MKSLLLAGIAFSLLVNALGAASGSLKLPDPAARLPEDVLRAESVTIEFYSREGKDTVTFSDPAWLQRLAGILRTATYRPESHCLCISYPLIQLKLGEGKTGSLSVHHGTKLRAYFGAVSGDFEVGEGVGRMVTDLAIEKRKE